jgi:hypothetical protein
LRTFVADTASLVIFSTILGGVVELLIAGLSVEQMVGTRLSALPIILLVGRPYGIYRDWIFRTLQIADVDRFKAILADTFANVSFQTPLYVILLALNGASHHQIFIAAGTLLLIGTVSGRPYGIFLTWVRRLFGV